MLPECCVILHNPFIFISTDEETAPANRNTRRHSKPLESVICIINWLYDLSPAMIYNWSLQVRDTSPSSFIPSHSHSKFQFHYFPHSSIDSTFSTKNPQDSPIFYTIILCTGIGIDVSLRNAEKNRTSVRDELSTLSAARGIPISCRLPRNVRRASVV